jgi:predicted dehydrogenase
MQFLDRRDFLKQSAGLSGLIAAGYFASDDAALAAAQEAQPAQPRGANERLNIAVIGVRGRGIDHIGGLAGRHNCRVTHLCDVDTAVTGNAVTRTQKGQGGEAPAIVQDLRRIMDNKEIHAVSIATPNHWHSLAAIWAMQAGKHVYVEKPLTRTPWEARLLTQAAEKYKVATQMGNQGYSHDATRVACEILWSGEIGDVREVHAWHGGPGWPQGMQKTPRRLPFPTP